eukprot:CAMPEP_0172602020 /NCGR_PEP_ID=MMETSP1068-20121228/22207_1 /TAXON_ID=35684 /ORGANISM="Pseudopedinella elastica, Strain CCMP716" /LENGTH=73 /DNA_ID=CAMNT_0013403243 /DNA_START=161 /DNA_END=382 /DNA_ORIENTATION=+
MREKCKHCRNLPTQRLQERNNDTNNSENNCHLKHRKPQDSSPLNPPARSANNYDYSDNDMAALLRLDPNSRAS